jgi:hypothetical protein
VVARNHSGRSISFSATDAEREPFLAFRLMMFYVTGNQGEFPS